VVVATSRVENMLWCKKFMMNLSLFLILLLPCCFAVPTELGISFDDSNEALPLLTLPYGTWRAIKYTDDVSPSYLLIQTNTLANDEIRSIFSKTFDLELHRSGI
jgi:hypothetical protein